MSDRRLQFYYDFASTYSYLAAMRIEDAAAAREISVDWKPFLLGPIFQGQGMKTSPFNLYPLKGAYMWRDMQRLADLNDLPFVQPEIFPQNGLTAARLAQAGLAHGWTPEFSRAVYLAEFGQGRDISDRDVLGEILLRIDVDAEPAFAAATADANKQALRANGEEAQSHNVFGAPSFVTPDGELFWGNDRLEAALDWIDRKERLPV